jgi:hypothetical protein
VVNFDPALDSEPLASFRAQYGLGTQVTLYGPYGGKLNNRDDNLELAEVEYRQPVTDTTWRTLQALGTAATNRTIRLTNASPGTAERYYRLTIPGSP